MTYVSYVGNEGKTYSLVNCIPPPSPHNTWNAWSTKCNEILSKASPDNNIYMVANAMVNKIMCVSN